MLAIVGASEGEFVNEQDANGRSDIMKRRPLGVMSERIRLAKSIWNIVVGLDDGMRYDRNSYDFGFAFGREHMYIKSEVSYFKDQGIW